MTDKLLDYHVTPADIYHMDLKDCLDKGMNANLVVEGRTILDHFLEIQCRQYVEIDKFRWLLEAGANPNLKNPDGLSALSALFHYASNVLESPSSFGMMQLTQLLLDFGAQEPNLFDIITTYSCQPQNSESLLPYIIVTLQKRQFQPTSYSLSVVANQKVTEYFLVQLKIKAALIIVDNLSFEDIQKAYEQSNAQGQLFMDEHFFTVMTKKHLEDNLVKGIETQRVHKL